MEIVVPADVSSDAKILTLENTDRDELVVLSKSDILDALPRDGHSEDRFTI